jgi:hypothetical protein
MAMVDGRRSGGRLDPSRENRSLVINFARNTTFCTQKKRYQIPSDGFHYLCFCFLPVSITPVPYLQAITTQNNRLFHNDGPGYTITAVCPLSQQHVV